MSGRGFVALRRSVRVAEEAKAMMRPNPGG